MNATSRKALAISKDEFSRMFRKCVPPTGWPTSIGVANSGGPDSTCLLFLIHRFLTDGAQESSKKYPERVVSITVDHDLQPSSSAMADRASEIAHSIGVEHLSSRIPWSKPPFPSRPTPDQALENIARNARYHLLFQTMTRANVNVIAFGHHADDQVETSLMRLGRGTTEIGAGGMRACRRWGMGMGRDEASIGWAGYEGMNRWIVRPLLDVSKDRILATCETNSLEYIIDRTNFQPHLTLRNAIRQILTNRKGEDQPQVPDDVKPVPNDIAEKLATINQAISSLGSVSVGLASGADQLRGAVGFLTSQVEDIDNQVDSNLNRCSVASPPGTYLMSLRGISHVRDKMVRTGMILRILRYASFHPWGSLRADGNRRATSISQIIEKLWNKNPFESGIKMFAAGGGVLWMPVVFSSGGFRAPTSVAATNIRPGESIGWLASRQPPLDKQKMKQMGITDPLHINITDRLVKSLEEWRNGASPVFEVLYDCRFLIRFNLERMPEDLAGRMLTPQHEEIVIYPDTRWFWPKVVQEWHGVKEVLHSEINAESTGLQKWIGQTDANDIASAYWKPRVERLSTEWITIEWIRSLAAI